MKKETLHCDIEDMEHSKIAYSVNVPCMFDHDQEDGKSKVAPYIENLKIEMCEDCFEYMLRERRLIYAYGAMGYNKYYLKK